MELRKRVAWLLGAVATLSGILAFMDYATKFGEWLSTTFGDSIVLDIRLIFYIIGILLFPLYLIVSYLKKTNLQFDTRFTHLRVHYSQKTDSPKTKVPAQPYYIVNWDTKQAYWVPDLIVPFVKKKKLQNWNSHYHSDALKKHFKKNAIIINERNPTPKELGLKFDKNGLLIRQTTETQIVAKLKGRKLSDVELVCLFSWYYRIPFLNRGKFPNKILLRKYSTNETFSAPSDYSQLFDHKIISKENYIRRPFESNKSWSKRYGYTYHRRRYSEKELLEEEY